MNCFDFADSSLMLEMLPRADRPLRDDQTNSVSPISQLWGGVIGNGVRWASQVRTFGVLCLRSCRRSGGDVTPIAVHVHRPTSRFRAMLQSKSAEPARRGWLGMSRPTSVKG